MIDPWEEISSALQGDYEVFRVHRKICKSPRTGEEHAFHLIESPDWVNVLPVTADGRFVMIEQYRHGSQSVTLEIPGGLIDASDVSPAVAARREMIEETGFDTDQIGYLGVVSPNPAVQTNHCYAFIARGAEPVADQSLDGAEDIVVRMIEPAEVPGLIAEGRISHALVIATFYLYEHQRR